MDPLATVRDKFNSGSLDVFSTKELVHFVTYVEYAVKCLFCYFNEYLRIIDVFGLFLLDARSRFRESPEKRDFLQELLTA